VVIEFINRIYSEIKAVK